MSSKFLRRPWLVIAAVLLLTGFLGFKIPSLIVDNEVKNFFPHDDPSYVRLLESEDVYGSQILMDIVIETTEQTILTPENIGVIKDLSDTIAEMSFIDDLQSLTNIDYVVGIDGGLSAESLVPDDFQGAPEEIKALRERIVDWSEMYERIIVSDDFRGSQIIVTIDNSITPEQMSDLYRNVSDLVDQYSSDHLIIRLAGDPVLSERAKEYMYSDLKGLIPVVSLVVLLCLFFAFRKLDGTLLPLITVLIATVWTMGLMAWAGVHFTVVSSCLPVLLIGVGSAYGIHVINHYYEDFGKIKRSLSREEHRDLVRESLKKIFMPVLLAAVTTVAGFISTITSPIGPLKTFAIFSGIGVLLAFLLSVTFIPSLLLVKSERRVNKRIVRQAPTSDSTKQQESEWHENIVGVLYEHLNKRRIRLIGVFVVIIALSIWGLLRLNVESSIINYFPKDSTMRRDVDAINERFAGTNTINFVIAGTQKGDLTDPEVLQDMDDLATYLKKKYPEIGKTVSFADFIKRMNKVMHVAAPEPIGESVSEDFGMSQPESFFAEDDASGGSDFSSFFGEEESDDGFSSFFDDEATEVEPFVAENLTINSQAMLGETPDVQAVMDLFSRAFAATGGGSDVSVDEFLDAVEKELNYNGAAYNEIPCDLSKYPAESKEELKNLISQYLLLYSGSLDQFADNPLQPSAARMQVQVTSHETKIIHNIIQDAKKYAEANFPEGYTIEAYGIAELEDSLTSMITDSQVSSLLIAVVIVFIILSIYFRSPAAGFIGAIPLALAILINFGIMGLSGINLDIVTAIVGSIAIGIGVDYTIHFMDNYHRERLLSDDLNAVTLKTLLVSGKAITTNAVSVGLGFLVLCLSRFIVLRYIGLLVAIVMLTSSVTSMTVLPVMLNLFKPKFISKSRKNDSA